MTDCFIVTCCVTLCALAGGCGNADHTPPTLGDVSVTTQEDTPVAATVSLTASDPAAVTLAVVTPPSHGALTGAGPTWTYTPGVDYAGADSAVVLATDSHGSSTATIRITVTAVDDAPVANPDSVATGYGVAATIAQATLLANDRDVDSTALRVTAVDTATHGTVVQSGSDVVFTPAAGFLGTASFVYTVSDGSLTAQAVVTIAVGTDQAPVANADAATTTQDTPLSIADAALLGNDRDPDGQTLAITSVGNTSHGSVAHAGTQVSFVPEPGFHGVAGFEYTISDGMLTAVAAVAVTVTAVDQAPVASPDVATVAEGSTANAIDVLANDADADGGAKAVAAVTQPARGTAALGPDGASILYTPAGGYCNQAPNTPPDTFTYTLTPGGSTATVSVAVACACGLHKPTDFVVGSNG